MRHLCSSPWWVAARSLISRRSSQSRTFSLSAIRAWSSWRWIGQRAHSGRRHSAHAHSMTHGLACSAHCTTPPVITKTVTLEGERYDAAILAPLGGATQKPRDGAGLLNRALNERRTVRRCHVTRSRGPSVAVSSSHSCHLVQREPLMVSQRCGVSLDTQPPFHPP